MISDRFFKHSKGYALIRKITSFYHSLYYREIFVVNAEQIPTGSPIIFTPNHQNALMDALAIIYTMPKQTVFMARADIFKKEIIRKILTFIKIMPVYRIRDGIESLSNNDKSFEYAYQILKNSGAIGIMPEGNHGDQRRLRPLKKGVARMAIQSQELLNSKAAIKIIPVGVEYSNYQGFRSDMLVIYGRPIEISDYLEEYKSNAARGLQSIRTKLADELRALMLNIDSDQYYDIILESKDLYSIDKESQIPTLYDKFLLEKKLTDMLISLQETDPDQLKTLKQKIDDLNYTCRQLNLQPWVFSWEPPKKIISIISEVCRGLFFFPFSVIATIFHALPYFLSEYFANKAEDKQFVSSLRFGASFLMYLAWYLIILAIPFSFIIKIALLVSMPVLGAITFDYWRSIQKTQYKIRYLLLKKQNNKTLNKAEELHKEVIQWLSVKINNA